MAGLFGWVLSTSEHELNLNSLITEIGDRGRNTSGCLYLNDGNAYDVVSEDVSISVLTRKHRLKERSVFVGYVDSKQPGISHRGPVSHKDVIVFHDGMMIYDRDVLGEVKPDNGAQVIARLIQGYIDQDINLDEWRDRVLATSKGIVCCAVAVPKFGKLVLFSNTGSLYLGSSASGQFFASESHALKQIGCNSITQIKKQHCLDIPVADFLVKPYKSNLSYQSSMPAPHVVKSAAALLQYPEPELKRCAKCILPETMPFIDFDSDGVCNYCHNYRIRNAPKPRSELFDLVESYRREVGPDCIVPFSGGRDSCYALHLIVTELKMRPITYTYDWGIVTDLGRRNISRMCGQLGIENIVVAADMIKKRRNIAMNLRAWLKSPDLGMLSILTAGDKHFFRYVETAKKKTGISLNLWGINPLEVTHFKAGFLGMEPDFITKRVYSHGMYQQLRYQSKRFGRMLKSPGYFNRSLWDTLSGEYYRSFAKKSDYFHVFDYWRWDEDEINSTLDTYSWERASDTGTTWRIGDGTAGFYNYVYYTVAGFTEHDTFRSNQVREGMITREEALEKVANENRPRYDNIQWYLDAVGIDFVEAIKVVNAIPKLYA